MFEKRSRGLFDFLAASLVIWAAAYHTPVGALLRSVAARVTSSKSTARPLLAYYSGGVYELEVTTPVPQVQVPDAQVLAAVPPGTAIGRGVYATVIRLGPDARNHADALARKYALAGLTTPDDAATLVARAKVDLLSDDAAVLAVFTGFDIARYAVERARAEGRDPTLEVLMRQLPPSSVPSVDAASSALTLGTAYGLSWPVAPGTRVSSPFGMRNHPTLGREQMHTGVDLSVVEGTEVHVVADGFVRRASEDDVNGRVVIVDHGRGVWTAYCHNSRLLVTNGQVLKAGDVISYSGNTGRSTGPHLHYQLELGHHPVDPFIFRGSKPLTTLPELASTSPTTRPAVPPTPTPVRTTPGALKSAFDKAATAPHEEEGTELPP